MKKKYFIGIALAVALPAIFLFAQKMTLTTYTPATISPEVLQKRLFKEGSYRDFEAWPDYTGFQKGRKAHGSTFKLYMSPELSAEWPLKKAQAPSGSIIVKEVYSQNKKKVETVLVMVKVPGFDDKNKDWYWAEFDAKGKNLQSGMLKSCIACHALKKDNDYVMSRDLK